MLIANFGKLNWVIDYPVGDSCCYFGFNYVSFAVVCAKLWVFCLLIWDLLKLVASNCLVWECFIVLVSFIQLFGAVVAMLGLVGSAIG